MHPIQDPLENATPVREQEQRKDAENQHENDDQQNPDNRMRALRQERKCQQHRGEPDQHVGEGMQHPMQDHRAGSAPFAEPGRHRGRTVGLSAGVDERRQEVQRARGDQHGVRAPVGRPLRVAGHRELPGERAAGVYQRVKPDDRHEHPTGARRVGRQLRGSNLCNEIAEYSRAEDKQRQLPRPAHASASSGVATPGGAYASSRTAATCAISATWRAQSPESRVAAKSWNSSANHFTYDALSSSAL